VAGRLSRGRELLRKRLSRRGVGLPLFLMLPLPALAAAPPELLVTATVATVATAPAAASTPGTLAGAVLRAGLRRRLGLMAVLLLVTAALLSFLGWHARPAAAQPSPAAPTGGCHAATS
jgi:hypothetical protein